jgi:LytTr DNA-binding domain
MTKQEDGHPIPDVDPACLPLFISALYLLIGLTFSVYRSSQLIAQLFFVARIKRSDHRLRQPFQIDGIGHSLLARRVGVEVVAGIESGTQSQRSFWVPHQHIEIHKIIERAGSSDPVIDLLPHFLLGRRVKECTLERQQSSADHRSTLGMSAGDDLAIGPDQVIDQNIRLGYAELLPTLKADVINARKNDHMGDSLDAQHVAIKPGEEVLTISVAQNPVSGDAGFDEIDCIKAAGDYAEVHCADRVWLVNDSISALTKRLPPADFARIHRSVIVRLARISEVSMGTHGDGVLKLITGTKLRFSRRYRGALDAWLLR